MSSSPVNLEYYLISLEEINFATEDFSPERCIGDGGFGKVYKGELSERWQNRTVAIKRLDRNSYQGEHEFRNELEMISRFHHKNILSFIGYCDEHDEMILVYEYAMNGSLDRHLEDPNKRCCITWIQRLKICIGAARGLGYLHSGLGEHNRVIHRDVKSGNILLDESLVAKICDFGLSKSGPRNQPDTYLFTKVAGTHFYLDPIYHESGILCKESDIYSFGVVLFEILSGMLVYSPRSIGNDKGKSLIYFVRRYYHNEPDKLIDPQIKDQIDNRSFDIFKEIAYQCISLNLTQRPTIDTVIERIEEALDLELEKNDVALTEYVMEDFKFSHGKPVAACTIYQCLLNQKHLKAERTAVFDQLIKIIWSTVEDNDNYNPMAYWLSNGCTLLFLIEKSLLPPRQTSLLERMMKRRFSTFKPFVELSEATPMVVQQVEAQNPALLFKQQLIDYVEKVYGIICAKLKKELGSLLALCIKDPPKSKGVPISRKSVGIDSQFNCWQRIVDRLNILLNTLKENFVPPIIVQKIFSQTFSYINVELFNSLLQRQDYCTVRNGEYVKAGLAELEHWCSLSKNMYVGSAWNKLKHIREAIGFLAIHKKHTISYDEIANDLCPILSIHQLYRMCTLYCGDINTGTISSNVFSSFRVLMAEGSNNGSSNYFVLKENHSIPFSVDDLSTSLHVKDFANVEPALLQLSKYRAFHFLYN